jgi:hypothetical protein
MEVVKERLSKVDSSVLWASSTVSWELRRGPSLQGNQLPSVLRFLCPTSKVVLTSWGSGGDRRSEPPPRSVMRVLRHTWATENLSEQATEVHPGEEQEKAMISLSSEIDSQKS